MKNIACVILGGGQGKRMMPLTLERAKPAVGFAGKYRVIDIAISNCINSGLKRLFLLTQFLSASLHRHIMQTYQFDAFSGGFIDILAAEQTPKGSDWFQGTADAVRATLNHISYYPADQILILPGDHLYRMDYSELIRRHRETRADITLSVYPVPREDTSRLGLLRTDASGAVVEFVEKPRDPALLERFQTDPEFFASHGLPPQPPDRYLASMGVYVFEPSVLFQLLGNQAHTDFGREVIPAAIENYKVVAMPFTGYWKDIGTIAAFFEANLSLARPDPSFRLYAPGWPIYTRMRSLPPNRIIHSEIRDSLVVEGSDITGAHISHSVIGARSVVCDGARLDHVVMLGSDFYEGEPAAGKKHVGENLPPLGIGKNCVIERAILDKNVRIGDGVVIRARPDASRFESETYWVRDGITIIPKDTVLPSGSII